MTWKQIAESTMPGIILYRHAYENSNLLMAQFSETECNSVDGIEPRKNLFDCNVEIVDWYFEESNTSAVCSCDTVSVLMVTGCRCGALEREREASEERATNPEFDKSVGE